MFLLKMVLAHLIGDYVVQGDRIAAWKERSVAGVMVHGIIVTIVTIALAFPFSTTTDHVYAAAAIGASHTVIDLINFIAKHRIKPSDGFASLLFFICDQLVHFVCIIAICALLGELPMPFEVLTLLHQNRFITLALAYTFISMPAWVLIEYAMGSLRRGGPDFKSASKRKYMTIIERGLVMTFLLVGQVFIIPLIAIPRLLHDRRTAPTPLGTYFGEFVVSILLTLGVSFTVLQLI